MMPGAEPQVDCLTDEVEKVDERRDLVPPLRIVPERRPLRMQHQRQKLLVQSLLDDRTVVARDTSQDVEPL